MKKIFKMISICIVFMVIAIALTFLKEITGLKIQNVLKTNNYLVNTLVNEYENKKILDKINRGLVKPQNIKLDIVYENRNMAIINKPPGMLSTATVDEKKNTLTNALLYKYGKNLGTNAGYSMSGFVNILDRNTSGLVVVAKNNKAQEFLQNQFYEKQVLKKYRAVVEGVIKQDSGTLDIHIAKDPNNEDKMIVLPTNKGGKRCLVKFKVLKRFKSFTYLELETMSYQKQQIRVVLSHYNHPIINDKLYGARKFKVKTNGEVLQCYKLSFAKPFSGDKIEIEVPPDGRIKKVLKYLESQKNSPKRR